MTAFTASGFDLTDLGGGQTGKGQTFGDVTGDLNDRVRVVLGGTEDILVATSYEVTQSVLTQPSSFSLHFGWGDTIQGLIAKVTPGRKFQLFINDTLQQTGAIDGYEATGDGNSGGSLTIHGRDALAPLHDAFIEVETSFANATYESMVSDALKKVYGHGTLFFSNDANRKLTTGIGVKPFVSMTDDAQSGVNPTTGTTGPTAKQIKTRIGERVYEFLKRQLDRAGLFLWAAGDGSFVLTQPNANQPPFFKLVRQRGQTRNAVNVTEFHHRNNTEGRYSQADLYGKGGGRKFGRTKVSGSYVDAEMEAWGFNRPLVLHDVNVTNNEQAEFYARRKLAETRRAGWSLVYTVAGHTIPSLATGARATWGVDTVVQVDDQELGIAGNFYIEKVVFRRNPKTTTEITLMRPDDLVFATGEFDS